MCYTVCEVISLDLLQLQYFQTIARLENISRAAEVLYVAQPNLSASLKRLEQELGVSLFDRRKGRVRLTPTGRLFLGYVDEVMERLDEGVSSAREADMRAESQVRVASAVVDIMGDMIDEFLPGAPDTSFCQQHCRNDEVAEKILSGDAEIGFLFGTPPKNGLEYIEIDRCERVIQLPAAHPLAKRGGLASIRELSGERLICNLSRDDQDAISELSHAMRVRLEPFFLCDDYRVELSMTIGGGGIAIAPVSNYLKLRRTHPNAPLACLRTKEELPPVRLGMIRKTGVHLSQAALQFYELVTKFFQSESSLADEYCMTLPPR